MPGVPSPAGVEPPPSSLPKTGSAADAARYMDLYLGDKVRLSLEKCLHNKPRDPIRFLAQSLRYLSEQVVASDDAPVAAEVQGEHTQDAPSRRLHWVAPPSVRLENGVRYELHPLAHDFCRAEGTLPAAKTTAPASVFPVVLYREAISSYEVASALRQLHMIDPTAPLVLFVECPTPTSAAFFYEGVAYRCACATGRSAAQAMPPCLTALQGALGAGKVSDFYTTIRAAAAEAVATVQVNFIPSLQVDYLVNFDTLDDALQKAMQTIDPTPAQCPTHSPRWTLPAVLLVSYKPDTARLTYARLLASYGPLYEAAQRASLQAFRTAQLERKRTYTYAFVMEYWAKVQERRQIYAGAARPINSSVKLASSIETKTQADEDTVSTSPAESAAPSCATEKPTAATLVAAVPASGGDKRMPAKFAKRGLLNYDAAHQAEDDVFLVVIRRLEHAAATLIQSVYRGYRARRGYQEAHNALHSSASTSVSNPPLQKSLKDATPAHWPEGPILPPLLSACLERLVREGDTFGSLWGNYVTSLPPESRRCWIYRPVQRHESRDDTEKSGAITDIGGYVREGWVQEELLLPPWRATQPRLHLNLFQRLIDYLALAQCTSLHGSVQLLLDSPGMSVLQRRAYDGIKSVCLNLFHVAYAELRQRQPSGLQRSFSAYMRQSHASVLGWLSTPHMCSLLVRAMQTTSANAVQETWQHGTRSRQRTGNPNATERSMSLVVQSQLAANECVLIVPCSLSANKIAAPAGTLAASTVWKVAPHLYISPEPLLARDEWVQVVTMMLESVGNRGADAPAPSVEWMTIANFPLCCVDGTPVAAVPRFDTQCVEGVPAYDSFVPRLAAGSQQLTGAHATEDATAGGSLTSSALAVQVASVVQEWVRGDLARAADVGLKHHICESLSSKSNMVYYTARTRKASVVDGAFTTVLPSATLLREVLQAPHRGGAADQCEKTGKEGSIPCLEDSGSLSATVTPQCFSVQSPEHLEAVGQESVSATWCGGSRTSSIATLPRTSDGTVGWGRIMPSPALPTTRPMAHSLAVPANVQLKAAEELEECALQVLTADDVAKEVSAALPEISFRHTRISMRFFGGPTVLKRLDAFLDRVAETLQRETHAPSLVLAVDLPSQGFYALAAALLVFRLHDTRDISTWSKSKATIAPAVSPVAQHGGVANDARVSFLSTFHEVLEAALLTPSASRAAVQCTPVQVAIQHVSQLMSCAPLPQLNLLASLCLAIEEAEAATAPSHAIVRATQLAEQYALLVLLDYYLWHSHSSFIPTGASLSSRGVLVRMMGNCAFAAFVSTVPAALEWIANIDPWQTSSPDVVHRRYSNALRRWDDKHYVCFGAL
ncbi:hypothetical protein LPMP_342610 [Leishmania panamensis]|uniref:Uncharacterized protein n=1 Tax=Leishmania panamensis TaxID=5679 RepID=A0A088SJ86_LEIPA|nr:hypothetical protein LPMP_342610 [Leishmania panamensis]AIO01887.1 hypothetical protein LPMP_342610 [Leishmania panamensis]